MLGAIIGDIIGSRFEAKPSAGEDFELFTEESVVTDDTVLTVAVADSLLHGISFVENFHRYFDRYPDAGYGEKFYHWAKQRETKPYFSCGNGAAMRVSPVGWLFHSREEVLEQARASAVVTHDHPDGIRAAQAVALGIFLLRMGNSKESFKRECHDRFGYNLYKPWEVVKKEHEPSALANLSVPPAIMAFLESASFEDAIRKAISLGGDTDTQACIAGALAEAFYGPEKISLGLKQEMASRTDAILDVVIREFLARRQELVTSPG